MCNFFNLNVPLSTAMCVIKEHLELDTALGFHCSSRSSWIMQTKLAKGPKAKQKLQKNSQGAVNTYILYIELTVYQQSRLETTPCVPWLTHILIGLPQQCFLCSGFSSKQLMLLFELLALIWVAVNWWFLKLLTLMNLSLQQGNSLSSFPLVVHIRGSFVQVSDTCDTKWYSLEKANIPGDTIIKMLSLVP